MVVWLKGENNIMSLYLHRCVVCHWRTLCSHLKHGQNLWHPRIFAGFFKLFTIFLSERLVKNSYCVEILWSIFSKAVFVEKKKQVHQNLLVVKWVNTCLSCWYFFLNVRWNTTVCVIVFTDHCLTFDYRNFIFNFWTNCFLEWYGRRDLHVV